MSGKIIGRGRKVGRLPLFLDLDSSVSSSSSISAHPHLSLGVSSSASHGPIDLWHKQASLAYE